MFPPIPYQLQWPGFAATCRAVPYCAIQQPWRSGGFLSPTPARARGDAAAGKPEFRLVPNRFGKNGNVVPVFRNRQFGSIEKSASNSIQTAPAMAASSALGPSPAFTKDPDDSGCSIVQRI